MRDGDRTPDALERAHRRARERGVSRPLRAVAKVVLAPLLRGWFGLRCDGREHVPADGAAIIACNHKSFLDPFFIGMALPRHVHCMAKKELFVGPLGWLLARLGAFPVRRGESDAEAVATARAILAGGGALVIFPEGTRVGARDALGAPHHGAGRLALEAGAPIVPAAIAGTERLWLGPLPRPRRVQLTFAAAIDPAAVAGDPDAVRQVVDRELWPVVREEYGRELARPGLALAALSALGLGGGLLARRQAVTPRMLGYVEPLKLRRRAQRRRLRERLPWHSQRGRRRLTPAAATAAATRRTRARCRRTSRRRAGRTRAGRRGRRGARRRGTAQQRRQRATQAAGAATVRDRGRAPAHDCCEPWAT